MNIENIDDNELKEIKAYVRGLIEGVKGFWATRNWEINFTLEDDHESIVAYPRKGGDTDWSKPIVLSERIRKWKTIV